MRRAVIILSVLVCVVWLIGVLLPDMTPYDGVYDLVMQGRLVDETTGDPIQDAAVLTFEEREWAGDEAKVEFARRRLQGLPDDARGVASEASPASVSWSGVNGAVSDALGTFSTFFRIRRGHTRRAWSWRGTTPPPPRSRCEALRIEIKGRDPVILDVPEGTWTEQDDGGSWTATWDLGVVEIPATP